MWHILEHTLANCVNACYHGNGKKIAECTHRSIISRNVLNTLRRPTKFTVH